MLGEAEPVREDTPEPEENAAKTVKEDNFNKNHKAAFKSAPVMYNTPPPPQQPKRQKIDISQPPIPGLEDEY